MLGVQGSSTTTLQLTGFRNCPSPDLVKRAFAAVARVRSTDSQLRDLWAESADALDEWLSVLAEVEARLTG